MTECKNRPEFINGYETTENPKPCPSFNTKNGRNSISYGGTYKVFNENAKGKKATEFGSTTVENKYSLNSISNNDEDDLCPSCGQQAIEVCPCVYCDKKCSEGHVWYVQRDGLIKLGNPH